MSNLTGYKIFLTKRAYKELKQLPLEIRKHHIEKILLLKTNIQALDIKKLKGSTSNLERIKVHPYRIIFKVYKDEKKILIITDVHRKDVYKMPLTIDLSTIGIDLDLEFSNLLKK